MAGEDSTHRRKGGLARRLFKTVGQAGLAVGGLAGDFVRSAGRTARSAGGRASLTFSSTLEATPPLGTRELAESLTRWLVHEHQGRADLQQQKPSTVELQELGQVSSFYEVCLQEPGFTGRRIRFVVRQQPLLDIGSNFPTLGEEYDESALVVLSWPQHLLSESDDVGVLVWDQACLLGPRSAATDLLQHWLNDAHGGTFERKRVAPKELPKPAAPVPIFGREEELDRASGLLLTPRPREIRERSLLSLAAPGGTGKSYFLKALRARVGHCVVLSAVDHQGIEEESSSVGLLGHILAQLARGLEEQGVEMALFRKELRAFRKRLDTDGGGEATGFFSHLKKAAESAAGINPILGAVGAGVVFLTSWGQQAREESEALARDNAVKGLTEAFKEDLVRHYRDASSASLAWPRPVLVFDTYEWLSPLIDTWLRTELAHTVGPGGFHAVKQSRAFEHKLR